jgi:hypothetical protein
MAVVTPTPPGSARSLRLSGYGSPVTQTRFASVYCQMLTLERARVIVNICRKGSSGRYWPGHLPGSASEDLPSAAGRKSRP